MKFSFDDSFFDFKEKEEERELDWIEKVLGRNEPTISFSTLLEKEISKKIADQLAEEIDKQIKDSYLNSCNKIKYYNSQLMMKDDYIVKTDDIVS
jgi:hypothetical protein